MKKLKNTIIALLLMLIIPAFAQAEVLPSRIFANPTKVVRDAQLEVGNSLTFKTIDEYKLKSHITIEKDSLITVKVNEYVPPKRGKRNGYFKIEVESYTIPSENNQKINVKYRNIEGTLRVTTETDTKGLIEETGVAVAEVALETPGLSQLYAISKGLIKPNEGQTRFESVGTNVYNSTGLQYIEKGQEMVLETDSIVVLSVK